MFSALLLRETIPRSRWAAAAVAICGGLLMAKPTFSGWDITYLVALAGAGLNGLAFVLNRYLQRKDTEATTMLYTNLVAAIGSAPALVLSGFPANETLLWLPGLLLCGPIGMYLGIVAVKHADASKLGPYTLFRLFVGVLGGIFLFQELPDMFSVFGALLILASCRLSYASGVSPSAADSPARRHGIALRPAQLATIR